MNQRDLDRNIIEHDNGFIGANRRLFELGTKPYVLPSQCEQVFYSKALGKAGWSFVVRHDPRGRLVKYNLDEGNEEGTLEEEDDDEEHDQHDELNDHDDPAEDVQELVESDDAIDNAHEYSIDDDMMIVTDLDDDDDMANPFNDDLDEEDDEVY